MHGSLLACGLVGWLVANERSWLVHWLVHWYIVCLFVCLCVWLVGALVKALKKKVTAKKKIEVHKSQTIINIHEIQLQTRSLHISHHEH